MHLCLIDAASPPPLSLLFSPSLEIFNTSSIAPSTLRARGKGHPVVLLAGKGDAQLEQLDHNVPKLIEERLVILGVPLHMLLELLILYQRHIRREHHQTLAPCILELLRPVPLPKTPLLAQQQSIVVITHHRRAESPGSLEAASVGVAATKGMGAAQSNDLAVVEAHAAEDGAKVLLLFGAIGEAAVRGAHADVTVLTAGPPGDGGALHFLNGADAGEGPEVRVGDPWELF